MNNLRAVSYTHLAMVTSIGENELNGMQYRGLFAGLEFQEDLERAAWEQGGKNLYCLLYTSWWKGELFG